MANRDLLRREDAADRISRVLGVSVARTRHPVAISEMDIRDGTLRPAGGQEHLSRIERLKSAEVAAVFNSSITQFQNFPISSLTVRGGSCALDHDADFGPFTAAHELRR